jgi:hypothetical protein
MRGSVTLLMQCPIIMTSNHSSPGGMLSGMRARSITFAQPSASQVRHSRQRRSLPFPACFNHIRTYLSTNRTFAKHGPQGPCN